MLIDTLYPWLFVAHLPPLALIIFLAVGSETPDILKQ
jgi:hypothetical protein